MFTENLNFFLKIANKLNLNSRKLLGPFTGSTLNMLTTHLMCETNLTIMHRFIATMKFKARKTKMNNVKNYSDSLSLGSNGFFSLVSASRRLVGVFMMAITIVAANKSPNGKAQEAVAPTYMSK